jgi:hypothetical protein
MTEKGLSKTSGAAKRRSRVKRGLSPYTERAQETRREWERQRTLKRYQSRRELIDGIKLERGCADCGYNAHAAATALHGIRVPEIGSKKGRCPAQRHRPEVNAPPFAPTTKGKPDALQYTRP